MARYGPSAINKYCAQNTHTCCSKHSSRRQLYAQMVPDQHLAFLSHSPHHCSISAVQHGPMFPHAFCDLYMHSVGCTGHEQVMNSSIEPPHPQMSAVLGTPPDVLRFVMQLLSFALAVTIALTVLCLCSLLGRSRYYWSIVSRMGKRRSLHMALTAIADKTASRRMAIDKAATASARSVAQQQPAAGVSSLLMLCLLF